MDAEPSALPRCAAKPRFLSSVLGNLRANSNCIRRPPSKFRPRPLGIFTSWRLWAYGGALATFYGALLLGFYKDGIWLVDKQGAPVYTDFTQWWVAGLQVLHGQAASLYIPAEFQKAQDALVGEGHAVFLTWPYPPTFLLLVAPLAMLPYVAAFLTWDLVTLLGCIAAVYIIVRRSPAIILVLASPFTAWNFLGGQNGFLTASLIGASLHFLERRPLLAGLFIGCLSYKPQFGMLFPVALAAGNHWRAFASAAATVALLAGATIAVFGTDVWTAFPRELDAHSALNLSADPGNDPILRAGRLQTVYGTIRTLHGGAPLALLVQGAILTSLAIIVWLLWRTRARYALKAATLSAAALIVTPWASACDMAAIVIPVAFLTKDQIGCGLLKGEQTIMIALFGASLLIVLTFGGAPIGAFMMIMLLSVILRRAHDHRGMQPAASLSMMYTGAHRRE
jgi:arabinofuranan 3-O-arabinosyltransferase